MVGIRDLVAVLALVVGCLAVAQAARAAESQDAPGGISQEVMQSVYDELATPHKVGRLLTPAEGEYYDCPNVFRHDGRWLMVFVSTKDKVGYETRLAESDDLVNWRVTGTLLGFRPEGWDRWQTDGSIALMDPQWGGTYELRTHDDKYWMSYFGGHKQGYETDPLAIGMAWTKTPAEPHAWNRLEENPVLSPDDADARPFEQATLYKSHILYDPKSTLGAPYIMYYNGKQKGDWIERIGMAVSDDLVHWRRHGEGPVIDNQKGISGDPQIIQMEDLWVMVYFGAGWKKGAFDTFAVSRDLVHWTKWQGKHLVEPTEAWDTPFAHKPWMIKHGGVVYHYYCSVGEGVRTIALATSKPVEGPAIAKGAAE